MVVALSFFLANPSSTAHGGAAFVRSNVDRLTFGRASSFWSPISKTTGDRSSRSIDRISFPRFNYLDLR